MWSPYFPSNSTYPVLQKSFGSANVLLLCAIEDILNNFVRSLKVVTHVSFPCYEVNESGSHFSNSVIFAGRQEEMMTGSNLSSKKRSLEDLFRPPLDLMFHGTFQNVRYLGHFKSSAHCACTASRMMQSCWFSRQLWARLQ